MNGTDYYNQVKTLLHGFGMDEGMFYMLLNTARVMREMERPWMVLRKLQSSQQAIPGNTYQTQYVIPADFDRLTRDGKILLFDGQQVWQEAIEIPVELQVQYKDQNLNFFMDHNAGKFGITGIIDRVYNIYINYVVANPDIAATTSWINIPTRFQPILAYDVVAMYELGVDYDDTNARNANKNDQISERLFNAMKVWDDYLQRSAVTLLDYPVVGDVPTFVPHKINMFGPSGT